jgi:hypothetical protein
MQTVSCQNLVFIKDVLFHLNWRNSPLQLSRGVFLKVFSKQEYQASRLSSHGGKSYFYLMGITITLIFSLLRHEEATVFFFSLTYYYAETWNFWRMCRGSTEWLFRHRWDMSHKIIWPRWRKKKSTRVHSFTRSNGWTHSFSFLVLTMYLLYTQLSA